MHRPELDPGDRTWETKIACPAELMGHHQEAQEDALSLLWGASLLGCLIHHRSPLETPLLLYHNVRKNRDATYKQHPFWDTEQLANITLLIIITIIVCGTGTSIPSVGCRGARNTFSPRDRKAQRCILQITPGNQNNSTLGCCSSDPLLPDCVLSTF